ncbi:RHS repeat domain-containing protein [Pseudomonas sp. LB3P31]
MTMLNALQPSLDAFTPKVTSVDPRGLSVRMIDYHRAQADLQPESRITRQKHDWQGRLVASIDPRLGRQAESDRSVKENICSQFSLSATTVFSDSVDAGWRLFLFNENGAAVCSWDSRGHFRQQAHDALNRLVAVTETMPDQPSAVVERLSYGQVDAASALRNQCGRLIRHDDAVGSEATAEFGLQGAPLLQARRFTHSLLPPDWPLDEEERETLLEQRSFTTQWQLSALGETLRQIDARQNTQRSSYGLGGQLKQVHLQINGAAEKPVVQVIGYNVDNRIVREVAGNGVVTACEYDDRDGRLVHLHCAVNAQRPLQSLRYVYDPVGNVVEINDEVAAPVYFRNQRVDHRCTYGYDSLYQLTWSTGFEALHVRAPTQLANFREDYEYDEAGNLRTLVHVGGNQYTRQMVTAIHSNRSLAVHDNEVPGEPEIAAGFDPNGNSRALLRGQVLEWDGRNQLQRVTPVHRPAGEDDCEVYVYDSQGRRLRKSATRLSKFGNVIREVRYLPGIDLHADLNSGKSYQVIRPGAGQTTISVMHWESEPPAGMAPQHWCYSHPDHLGSSSLELNQAADVLSQEWYLPYGGTAWWVDNGSPQASYKTIRYSGKERDASGLYYYGLRYYAPWLQRWINPDPAGRIDGLNLYRFVRNNPITLSDSNGLSPPVTIVFGWSNARYEFSPNFADAHQQQSVVHIEDFNNALNITDDEVFEDYFGVMKKIGEGIAIADSHVESFKNESPHFRGSDDDARGMLQSWADHLKENVYSLNIVRKLNNYAELTGQGKPSDEYWKKNSDDSISTALARSMTEMIKENPDEFFAQDDRKFSAPKTTVAKWFFRQTSKMGLDWFAQTQDQGGIIFLDVASKVPDRLNSGWMPLQPQVFEAKPYKEATSEIGEVFNAITFSERRHLKKKMADPQSCLARKTQVWTHAKAAPYFN